MKKKKNVVKSVVEKKKKNLSGSDQKEKLKAIRAKRSIASQVMDARSVATPIIAIETPDPNAINSELLKSIKISCEKAKAEMPPVLLWDAAGFLRALNEEGLPVLEKLLEESGGDPAAAAHPAQAMSLIANTPPGSFIIMRNLHRFWEGEHPDMAVIESVFNIRDAFKSTGRTLVITLPNCVLPAELRHDVVVLTEKLPSAVDLKPIVEQMHDSANLPQPDEKEMETAARTLAGLAKQQAEQVIAMSLVHGSQEGMKGMSMETLRSEQYAQIEQTAGLTVYRGDASFDRLLGLDKLTGLLRNVIGSKNPTRAFVFIDEIEKMLAGGLNNGADTSGTSQEQLGYILSHMQDTEAKGILLVGPAGVGKSEIAKACGREADCLTVAYDIGATKGSLVGESGAMTRQALSIIESLGQGNAFWIATCNSIDALPVELRRRFTYGTWYVDLPSREALSAIWKMYSERYGVKSPQLLASEKEWDEGWTGAEVKTCCSMASEMDITVKEASTYISPVSRSSWETIQKLRSLATGRFLCAERGGFYRAPEKKQLNRSEDGLIEQTGGRLISMKES